MSARNSMEQHKDTKRVGVVGIGHLGTYHLQKYRMIPSCEIVGVADTVLARAEEAAGDYGCEAFGDHRELIGKVDAVSIAVPTRNHHEVAKDFLAEGVDVLIEKPIAVTIEEADDLIRIADEKDAILQVGLIERFNPAITALEKVIQGPLFIESHRLHPFFERGTDVDVILDLMIHDLDLILHFVRSSLKSVDAVGVSVLSHNVDISNVRLTFENGCVANITASRVTSKTLQKMRFFGFEGYHAVDFGKRELVSLHRTKNEAGQIEISRNDVAVKDFDPLEKEVRAFVDSIITRTVPRVSGHEARKSLDVALRIIDKMKTGQELLS